LHSSIDAGISLPVLHGPRRRLVSVPFGVYSSVS
jgi:hypothetical protein